MKQLKIMHGVLLCVLLLVQSAAAWNVLFVNVLAKGSHQTISGYLANLLVNNTFFPVVN